jgi:hypothetical protein
MPLSNALPLSNASHRLDHGRLSTSRLPFPPRSSIKHLVASEQDEASRRAPDANLHLMCGTVSIKTLSHHREPEILAFRPAYRTLDIR